MPGIPRRRLELLLELLHGASVVDSFEAFPVFLLQQVPALINCDSISYNEVDPERQVTLFAVEPQSLRDTVASETVNRVLHDHPCVQHYIQTGDQRALKLSDFLTRTELHATSLYRDLYAHVGTEFQLSAILPAPQPRFIGIALNRQRRDFNETDRTLLNLARGYLELTHVALLERTRMQSLVADISKSSDGSGQSFVLLGRDCVPEFVTEGAAALLAKYFPSSRSPLPPELQRWAAAQDMAATRVGSPHAVEPLIYDRAGTRLVVRYLPKLGNARRSTLVFSEQRRPFDPRLTAREMEVLDLVASGHRSPEIAKRMGITPATVQKHLERVYDKLGVTNRVAALASLGWRPVQPDGR